MEENEKKVNESQTNFEDLISLVKNLEKNLHNLKDIGEFIEIDELQINKISSEVETITNKFDSVVNAIEIIKSSFNNFQYSLEKIERNFEDLHEKPVGETLTTGSSMKLIRKIFSLMSENESKTLIFGREYLTEIFSKDLFILNDPVDRLPKFIQEVHQLLEELSIFIEYNNKDVEISFKE